ncbi:unnamed protein product [Owenia fusiformis]|uniref:Uncharacterized protein n=1 Tax=Owenia fusiformis TaxID=6347 RepID=A0A8J1TGI0_OWEFU|nr:unnamed protein product [Owenia fusiformis]
MAMPLNIYDVVRVNSLMECMYVCVQDEQCASFNFGTTIDNDTTDCELCSELMSSCYDLEPKSMFGYWRNGYMGPESATSRILTTTSNDSTNDSTTPTNDPITTTNDSPTPTDDPITNSPTPTNDPITTTTGDNCGGSIDVEAAYTSGNEISLVDKNNGHYTSTVNSNGSLNSVSARGNLDLLYGGLLETIIFREINSVGGNLSDGVNLFFNGNDIHCMDKSWLVDNLGLGCLVHGFWTKTITQIFGAGTPSTVNAAVEATSNRTYLFDDITVYISERHGLNVVTGSLVDSYGIRDSRAENLWLGIPNGVTAVAGWPDNNDQFLFFVGKTYYVYDTVAKQNVLGPLCVPN